MRLIFTATIGCIVCFATIAAKADNKDVAREAYAEGTRHYDLNEFAPALDAFKRAYLAYEEPAFLFNIAQCYRQLGNKTEAVKFYRTYLRKVPDAPNREEVERLITNLGAEIAREKPTVPQVAAVAPAPRAATTAPSTPTSTATLTRPAPVPARRTPVYKKWWLWTIVGVVAAGAATGIAVAVTSQHSEDSFMPVVVTR